MQQDDRHLKGHRAHVRVGVDLLAKAAWGSSAERSFKLPTLLDHPRQHTGMMLSIVPVHLLDAANPGTTQLAVGFQGTANLCIIAKVVPGLSLDVGQVPLPPRSGAEPSEVRSEDL